MFSSSNSTQGTTPHTCRLHSSKSMYFWHWRHCQLIPIQVLELALGLGLTWAASLLLFLFADYIALPAFARWAQFWRLWVVCLENGRSVNMIDFSSSPLGLLAFYALFFLNPTKSFKYKERQWMMGVFLRSIMIVTNIGFEDDWSKPASKWQNNQKYWRLSIMRKLFRIVITPLSYVTFADFWVAGFYFRFKPSSS